MDAPPSCPHVWDTLCLSNRLGDVIVVTTNAAALQHRPECSAPMARRTAPVRRYICFWVSGCTTLSPRLTRFGEKRCFWKNIIKQRVELIGHNMHHENFIKPITEGYVKRKRGRGKPRLQYIKQIIGDVSCNSLEKMQRKVEKMGVENCCKLISGLITKKKEGNNTSQPKLIMLLRK